MRRLDFTQQSHLPTDIDSIAIRHIDIQCSDHLKGIAPGQFMTRLQAQVVAQIKAVHLPSEATDVAHYTCSSTLDIVSSGGWFEPAQYTRHIESETGLKSAFSNAMQCATWGSLLRQHIHNRPAVKHILLSIVDANPLSMRFWEDNQSWGRTSHRISLVHLQLPEQVNASGPVDVLKCNPQVMLYEYAGELQRAAKLSLETIVCPPYFESKMRKGLKRSLKEFPNAPDRYQEYGHVCGADPWISVALACIEKKAKNTRYLLSSIASEGYFCLLHAHTTEQTQINFEG